MCASVRKGKHVIDGTRHREKLLATAVSHGGDERYIAHSRGSGVSCMPQQSAKKTSHLTAYVADCRLLYTVVDETKLAVCWRQDRHKRQAGVRQNHRPVQQNRSSVTGRGGENANTMMSALFLGFVAFRGPDTVEN